MNKSLEKYLDTIDKHLKSIPTSERVDIIKEIKSYILEMEKDGLTDDEILNRLGDPKEMAKSYLGDLISKSKGFHWDKYLTVFAFYSLTGFTGMFVIPTLAIVAPVFIFCGIITPIGGAVKLLGYLLNFDVPFIMFQLGSITLHPILSFVLSIFIGIGLYYLGRKSWKLLLKYIQSVSKKKSDLFI